MAMLGAPLAQVPVLVAKPVESISSRCESQVGSLTAGLGVVTLCKGHGQMRSGWLCGYLCDRLSLWLWNAGSDVMAPFFATVVRLIGMLGNPQADAPVEARLLNRMPSRCPFQEDSWMT